MDRRKTCRWKALAVSAVLAGSWVWTAVALAQSSPAAQAPPAARPDKAADKKDKKSEQRDVFDLPLEQLQSVPVRPSGTPATASGFDVPVSTLTRALDFAPTSGGSGTAATVGRSPAAVYVLTEEDIRRSGHRSIPELLRMVPGMNVARIDANKWAVSSRGFNDRFANKLQVLIDGRSVYTPLFAGVFWDERDTLLEDIERIEVIRGPGATLWGANAVNGVINIVTKKSQSTQGSLLVGGAGSEERGFGSFRHGGKLGDDMSYRVYVKYFDRDQGADLLGRRGPDAWHASRGGFRLDWDLSPADTVMFQGDLYSGDLTDLLTTPDLVAPFRRTFRDPVGIHGGFALGRWTHVFSETSNVSFQVFYDRTERLTSVFHELRNTIDFDFQHRFQLTERQEIVYGFGYRVLDDITRGTPFLNFVPSSRATDLVSFFAQDDITVVKDRLHFILGTKVEHNDYVGFVLQPGARLLWTPDEKQTVWAALSRAVRTPARADDDVRLRLDTLPPGTLFPGAPPTALTLFGNSGSLSEEMLAHEIGYRVTPTERLLVDVTGFLNLYENLGTSEPQAPFLGGLTPPHLVLPLLQENRMRGETYGVELATNWKVTDAWQLRAGYTWLNMQLHPDGSSLQPRPDAIEGNSPRNQFHVRSFLDLPYRLQLDTGLYYVDSLPNLGIPRYVRLDLRLGWHPRENLEVVLALQNLLDPRHPEFVPAFVTTPATQAERSIYGMVRWKF